jgi:hypothetical protein
LLALDRILQFCPERHRVMIWKDKKIRNDLILLYYDLGFDILSSPILSFRTPRQLNGIVLHDVV